MDKSAEFIGGIEKEAIYMKRIDADGILTRAARDKIEAALPSFALMRDTYMAWLKAQRDATREADIEVVGDTERRIREYLKDHTREGDCPCPEHQGQMERMALEIVGIVTAALEAQR